jgi:hypothetical protein
MIDRGWNLLLRHAITCSDVTLKISLMTTRERDLESARRIFLERMQQSQGLNLSEVRQNCGQSMRRRKI